MMSVTPSTVRKVDSEVDGWAWPGLAVCEKASVDWIEMISPAIPKAPRNMRSTAPIIRPIRISRRIWPKIAPVLSGTAPTWPPRTGNSMRANRKAKASRIRAGTEPSPTPGISISMAPSRAKTSPAA